MSKRFKGWLAGVCWDIGDFFFGLWTRWEKYDEGEWVSVEIANPRMEALEAVAEAAKNLDEWYYSADSPFNSWLWYQLRQALAALDQGEG